jgi:SSS family solute:Na+ symporter
MMSSVAASITACSAVFTGDLYQVCFHRNASERNLLLVSRCAAVGAVLFAFAAASAMFWWHWKLNALVTILVHCSAPLLAVILLGMFYRRVTAHGAFSGLVAGILVAVLANVYEWHYPAIHLWTPVTGTAICLIVAVVVSWRTKPHPGTELTELVHTPRAKKAEQATWWKNPRALAAAILLAAIAMALIFV